MGRCDSKTAAVPPDRRELENYDLAHAPLRNADLGQAEYQMLIDVRRFVGLTWSPEPAAQIELSVRLVGKNGTVVASRLFEENEKFASLDPPAAVAAFNAAFGRMAKNIIA